MEDLQPTLSFLYARGSIAPRIGEFFTSLCLQCILHTFMLSDVARLHARSILCEGLDAHSRMSASEVQISKVLRPNASMPLTLKSMSFLAQR